MRGAGDLRDDLLVPKSRVRRNASARIRPKPKVMSLSLGSKLGPYEILSLLGAGGMGEVYRARDPRLARDVAIKVLPAERMADEDRRRRFVGSSRCLRPEPSEHRHHPRNRLR